MINHIVNGSYTSTITSTTKSTGKILYLPINKSHFELSLIMAESSKFKSLIYAANFELKVKDYLTKHPETETNFVLNRDSVAGILMDIDKVVIFMGFVLPFLPKDINDIVMACLKVNKPLVEVPHGMYQTGYHLIDDSKIIDTRSHFYGFGGSLPSFSSVKLSWTGSNGFGYPRTIKRNTYIDRVLPQFTLITSNTNWYLYSISDKRNFYKHVFDYARANPDKIFVWCAHPAELSEGTFSYTALKFRPRNVYLYGIDNDIYFNGLEGTDDLIPYCQYGISTVSTCLLDYEIHNKRVNIFDCDGVHELTAQLNEKSLFTNSSQISVNAAYLKTGQLKEFDANILDSGLESAIGMNSEVSHHYLTSFI